MNYTGLIIGVKNSSDMNRTVELLTKDNGIVYVYAAGARKLTSRFLPLTNIYSLVGYECNQNGTMNILSEGKLLGGYYNITENIEKFSLVADVLSVIKRVATENEYDSRLYGLAIAFMEMLNKLDFDENNEEAASITVKTYVYLLAFLDIDVRTTAKQYTGGEALAELCDRLSGRRVSDAMMTTEYIDDVYMVYELLKQIYKDTFDLDMRASF